MVVLVLLVHRRSSSKEGPAVRRPEGELYLIERASQDPILPAPSHSWRRRTGGGQLKTWSITLNVNLEPIPGYARWRKDWALVCPCRTAELGMPPSER